MTAIRKPTDTRPLCVQFPPLLNLSAKAIELAVAAIERGHVIQGCSILRQIANDLRLLQENGDDDPYIGVHPSNY